VYASTALVIDEAKAAALFFDHVVPVYFLSFSDSADALDSKGPADRFEVARQLLPPVLLSPNQWGVDNEVIQLAMFAQALTASGPRQEGDVIQEALKQTLRNILEKFPTGALSHFRKRSDINVLSSVEMDTVSIALSNLKLVEERKLSWNHILEVRRDARSIAKLRRVRLLFHEDYSGKPASYIQDDILRRLDEYDETVRKWGLNTALQSMEMVCSSKSLPAAAVAAMVAGLGGGIPLAAALGSILEVGKIGLNIVAKRRELLEFKSHNPVSYLVELRDKHDG
jgi:hypothetical protein